MSTARTRSRGFACRGRVVTAYDAAAPVHDDGLVVVAADGRVAACGPAGRLAVPPDLPVVGDPGTTVAPGIVDAHVHLAFAEPRALLEHGVVAARDLGAPPADARRWRATTTAPVLAVAGPLLTAPGGYPTGSWGAAGFARPVGDRRAARRAVRDLAADRVDLVKIALEPAGARPVPSPDVVAAVVDAAHAEGLAVTCHALTAAMVERALDAGVDELCHTPTEPLPRRLVDRIAATRVAVVSTLQALVDAGGGPGVMVNARALAAAGVELVYGTDLGNTGTRPGAEPRELTRLADAGLGRLGALRSATVLAAGRPGLAGRVSGRIRVGDRAALVVLPADPLRDLDALRRPLATCVEAHVVSRAGGSGRSPRG